MKKHYTPEDFEAVLQKKVDEVNEKIYQAIENQKNRLHIITSFEFLSAQSLIEEWDCVGKSFTAHQTILEDFLDEIEVHMYQHDEEPYEYYHFHYNYFPFNIEEFNDMTDLDLELYKEICSGMYLDAWLYDESQGSVFEKAYDIIVNQDYYSFDTKKEYEEAMEEAIKELIENREPENEDEEEDLRQDATSRISYHSVHLSDGSIAVLLVPMDEIIEDL